MKVTTTITVEIKDAKHDLTKAEAQQLLSALQAALTPHVASPLERAVAPSIFDKQWSAMKSESAEVSGLYGQLRN